MPTPQPAQHPASPSLHDGEPVPGEPSAESADAPSDDTADTPHLPESAGRVLHMVGNAHIDPVWLWRWPEGYQEARATFWSAIERMAEYPDFVFTCNQVALLAWVEESDPALFEEIRKRVADGRWVNVGGWWVEPDCNLPTGESFCRQGLYGQHYLAARFGVTATVGLNADPFGHHAMIPAILRRQGITGYTFLRPGPHEAELPGQPFWWESPDGSRVLTARIPHEYAGPRADVAYHTEKAIGQLPPGSGDDALVFYGVGNHGGGPTRANLDSIRHLDEMGSLGRLRLSSPVGFFEAARASGRTFPVWRGDLQHHAAGCYAAHSGIKQWVRHAEHALLVAEKWAAVAHRVVGTAYPHEQLRHAWKLVLFNQFHDILPGTSIEPAYDDARDDLGEARAIARRATNLALQTLARDITTVAAGEPSDDSCQPVLVFNPHPWPVQAQVEVEANFQANPAVVTDDTGHTVPVQATTPLATVSDVRRRRLAFTADVPPLGYRLYRVQPPREGLDAHEVQAVRADDTSLENPHLRVEVDPSTGWLRGLLDKATGAQLVPEAPGPHTVVTDDHTDTWGHRVVSYAHAPGNPGESFRCRSVRLVEHGPVRSVLRVHSTYGKSTLVEDLVLTPDASHVQVRVRLDWHEQLKLLKLRFPTALEAPQATYEIPYGHLSRPTDGAEEPGQSWVDVTGTLGGTPAGLTVVNDTKPAYDVSGADIGITAVRSPVYAWHDPKKLDPAEDYSYQDQGRQEFSYVLVPHAGDWHRAGVVRTAAELAQPVTAMFETFHSGSLPASSSFAHATSGSVALTVLKHAETDDGTVVVRAHETAGHRTQARLDLPFCDQTIEAAFGPHEIKTFLVPVRPGEPVVETDLLERPEGLRDMSGTS